MYIYNVTVKIDESIAVDWLQWLQQVHAPEVVATGCFTNYTITKLLEVDDAEGPTYAIQYFAATKADYNRYIELHAPTLRNKSIDKWGEKFFAFRTLMEIVQ